MSLRFTIGELQQKREAAGLGMLSLGLYGTGDLVSSTPIPGTRMGGMPDPSYGGHLLGEGMTREAAMYLGALHNHFPALAEAAAKVDSILAEDGDVAYLMAITQIAEKHGWNIFCGALGVWIDEHLVDIPAQQAVAQAQGLREQLSETQAGLNAALKEAGERFQRHHTILGSSAGEELSRRAERVMKALEDARHEAGKAQAQLVAAQVDIRLAQDKTAEAERQFARALESLSKTVDERDVAQAEVRRLTGRHDAARREERARCLELVWKLAFSAKETAFTKEQLRAFLDPSTPAAAEVQP